DAHALAPDVGDELAAVVRRALAKDPEDRFPSAGDLGRAALAAAGTGPAPPPERVVARGAAAPGGFGDEQTAVPASVAPTEVAPPRRRMPSRLRPLLAPGLSLIAGAAVVLATVLLLGGGGGGHKAATTSRSGTTATM